VATRVLIVDDNASFLTAARVLLEREGVNVVDAVSTTAEALRQAAALRPDVVLVDIKLGEESGFELARRLAQLEPDGGCAVILISTLAAADVSDLVAHCPATGFLPKSELSAGSLRRILDDRSR
jgi:DNA-binding NarL/FixJ family response regulator